MIKKLFYACSVLLAVAALCFVLTSQSEPVRGQANQADPLLLPNSPDSLKFAVIGDSGTGGRAQRRVAQVMASYRQQFDYKIVLMAGDNMYGRQRPRDYEAKFELPYQALLEKGVRFYAALGNHDRLDQRFYEPFHLNGERYHTVQVSDQAQLFVLDSSRFDAEQASWLKSALESSRSPWKFILLHHPLYSAAKRHGSKLAIREMIEPLLVANGVDVVFAGHDHVYERKKPQQGITHFVVGNSAKLRKGNLRADPSTATGFDDGYSFLLVEVLGDELHFQAISDQSRHIDGGTIVRRD